MARSHCIVMILLKTESLGNKENIQSLKYLEIIKLFFNMYNSEHQYLKMKRNLICKRLVIKDEAVVYHECKEEL